MGRVRTTDKWGNLPMLAFQCNARMPCMRVGDLNDEPRSVHYVPLGWRVSAGPDRSFRPDVAVALALVIAAGVAALIAHAILGMY